MCARYAARIKFSLPKFAAHPQNLIALFITSRFLKRRRRFSSHSLVRRYCMFTTIKAGAEGSRFNVDRLEPHKISNNDFIAILNVFNQLANEHTHNVIHTFM
jgi:hypothetical protein